MKPYSGEIHTDVVECVDKVIKYVGKDIVMAMTLGLGKPVHFVNEVYRRAKEDPEMSLVIYTALPLEKPTGSSGLERRIYDYVVPKLFEGVPDIEYMLDYRQGKMPSNVKHLEFFSLAGGYLHDDVAQQNHIDSNYTHIVRDALGAGVNVFGAFCTSLEVDGKTIYSMGCNTDIITGAMAVAKELRAGGYKFAVVGECNQNLPFMYGDAVIEGTEYDMILKGPEYNYNIFGVPKDPVSLIDHMIGLNTSVLLKDGGTIQVGIGSLGDAVVNGMIMRNDHNDEYKELLKKMGLSSRNEQLIEEYGGTDTFEQGLYGSSEMFVDAFMQLYKNKILKRKVYESVPLMKLINEGYLKDDYIPEDIIDRLIEMKAVHSRLDEEDFKFLTQFGILRQGLKYENGTIMDGDRKYSSNMNDLAALMEIRALLGKNLLEGTIIQGAFFIGPRAFYQALNDMPEEERSLFGMSGVEKVNQLYGDEELRRLQRKDGRFINTAMIVTLMGSVCSDYLENGRVVSGVGGQYNFVSMGHALPDGRVIIMLKSTRGAGKTLKSNILFSYGHCTIPKHLRDIIVTEYGIADLRGLSDAECIAAMLKITDSRFQPQLLEEAKKSGKLWPNYEIPAENTNNYPEKIQEILQPYVEKGYFVTFPFGSDFCLHDQILTSSMQRLAGEQKSFPGKTYKGVLKELFRSVPKEAQSFLEALKLDKPQTTMEKIYRKLVVYALRNAGVLEMDATKIAASLKEEQMVSC